ncbi:CopD family protein [Brackiella oedipodis]|uniref:CopD family protein n=1 Tax=Brackiella oedipodis TaxID=124225 RepID=UPI00048F16C7|nr:CopD family protein [Brackiella oedipodis]
MTYLWLKVFHIVMVVSWYAGLFYLPRIFVNLAMQTHPEVYGALLGMSKRLLRFMTIIAAVALLSGLGLVHFIGIAHPWLWLKLALVACLLAYHYSLWRMYRKFNQARNQQSHVFYRYYNELPLLLLLLIVALVVIKPF